MGSGLDHQLGKITITPPKMCEKKPHKSSQKNCQNSPKLTASLPPENKPKFSQLICMEFVVQFFSIEVFSGFDANSSTPHGDLVLYSWLV